MLEGEEDWWKALIRRTIITGRRSYLAVAEQRKSYNEVFARIERLECVHSVGPSSPRSCLLIWQYLAFTNEVRLAYRVAYICQRDEMICRWTTDFQDPT